MMVEFKQAHLEAEYKEAGYAHIIANGYICNDLYSMLHGIEYEPFTAPDAVFDPATELGDQVKIGDKVHSSIYSMDALLGMIPAPSRPA